MKKSLHALAAAFSAAALLWPLQAQAQVCNGLPFRGRSVVAATYLSGDAPDTPYALRQYGASLVHQLNGWSPMGTHHAVRLDGIGGRATWSDLPTAGVSAVQLRGRQLGGGVSYSMDALPGSVAGPYVVCLSAGLQGVAWKVAGASGAGVTAPAWLSFGVPFRAGAFGAFPHAAFGGYVRGVTGDGPGGDVRARGVRPFGDSGLGVMVGPLRLDGSVHHEFKTRSRVVITLGFDG